MNTEKKRESGLDIAKALATFFVVAIHFYLSCGYYNAFIASPKIYVMTCGRWLFIAAVPLFLMSTGYFKINKTVNKSHYLSLIPIGITYFVLCTIRMICENAVYGKIHTFSSGIRSLFNYSAAWYVGMYIALMLMCPFLNKLWKMCNEKEHKILIISLVIVTMGYPMIQYVFPSFFQSMYPITYYFIGAYVKEYKPKFNKLILGCIAIVCVAVDVLATVYYSQGLTFNSGYIGMIDNGQNAFTVALMAVCIFLMVYDVKISNKPLSAIISSISSCSLEIYLLQAAFNAVIYTYLGRRYSGAEQYFWIFFITVPISFVCSWAGAMLYKKIYSVIGKIIKK